MSIVVKLDKLSNEKRDKISNDLDIELLNESKYAAMAPPERIVAFELIEDRVYLPFAYASRELKMSRPSRDSYPVMNVNFEGELRDEQQIVKKETIAKLSKTGSVIISAYCGFGKSILAINLACSIKLKTMIIVNKLVLIEQWTEEILQFCPTARVVKMTAKSKWVDADFYIMNAINIEKKGREFFKEIGFVIGDEAHLLVAKTSSRCFRYLYPRYIIGMSATPYRTDGLGVLLDLYFGTDKITRILHRDHLAYKVYTGFSPKMEKTEQGMLNWTMVLDSQARDDKRNELIVKIVKFFDKRTFLILTKFVCQGEYLLAKFEEEGISVTSLIGKNQVYDKTARVLVGTGQKVGTGFNHPKLDTLLLAADLESYYQQYLGRCMRKPDIDPVIFDLVDKGSSLLKHFKTRAEVYKAHGGTIRNFNISMLDSVQIGKSE